MCDHRRRRVRRSPLARKGNGQAVVQVEYSVEIRQLRCICCVTRSELVSICCLTRSELLCICCVTRSEFVSSKCLAFKYKAMWRLAQIQVLLNITFSGKFYAQRSFLSLLLKSYFPNRKGLRGAKNVARWARQSS